MKQLLFVFASIALTFVACDKDDVVKNQWGFNKVAYVVNYGSYSGSKGEISVYDREGGSIVNDTYKTANNLEFSSNIETMAIFKNIAYFMSNNGDKIDVVDAKTLKASINPIAADITKPRYFAAKDGFAYISCWGDVKEWTVYANSYIAKINLATNAVSKIALPGGPEGVIIAGNKLYAGLCATNKVAVIDLTTEAISYIEVSAVPQQFVMDADGKIWVSLISSYSVPFAAEKLGVAVIDPSDNTVKSKIDFPEMGDGGFISVSGDGETVYVMGKEAWPGTASSIYAISVSNQTVSSKALISGEKFNGFNVNPENDDIYVLISPSVTEKGTLKVYSKTGDLIDEETTGIAPKRVVFYNL